MLRSEISKEKRPNLGKGFGVGPASARTTITKMADKKETEPSFGEASNGNPRWAKLGAVNNGYHHRPVKSSIWRMRRGSNS
jgi:hypothetical protein